MLRANFKGPAHMGPSADLTGADAVRESTMIGQQNNEP